MPLLSRVAAHASDAFPPGYEDRITYRLSGGEKRLVAYVVLAASFFLVVTPLGLLFRLAGRDVLVLRERESRDTYWEEKEQPQGMTSYFRTF